MQRVLTLTAIVFASVVMAAAGQIADTAMPKKASTKTGIPIGWVSKLKLTAPQKQQLATIHASYAGKIEKLQADIADLRNQERTEMVKALTPEQRSALRKFYLPVDEG
jgi:Spy/CpxP family protein refolding chaperone